MKSGKQRRTEIKLKRHSRAARQAAAPAASRPPPRGSLPVDASALASCNSYGYPEFVARAYYQDMTFDCKDCGVQQCWRAADQKWWYEQAKGYWYSTAVRCRPCRQRERQRKAEWRARSIAGALRKARLPTRHCGAGRGS